jgi:hypothetical protein
MACGTCPGCLRLSSGKMLILHKGYTNPATVTSGRASMGGLGSRRLALRRETFSATVHLDLYGRRHLHTGCRQCS